MFGDGSDGILNVTSGTHNLSLNTKHQFESVNISAGATLSTSSTTGAVLYITALTEIRVDGTIDVSGKVNPGRSTWSTTIDGITYSSPGVPDTTYYQGTSYINYGFGGGGAGTSDTLNGTTYYGGAASTGGTSPSSGTATASRSSNGTSTNKRNGQSSGGGSGVALAYIANLSGTATVTATGGAGGSSYGANGGSGSGSHSISGSMNYAWTAGGGGGAGGIAGRAGVHVVLKAPTIIINGMVVTSGTNGGDGGDGGREKAASGWTSDYGSPGLAGAGGNAGNFYFAYAEDFTLTGAITMDGGAGGAAGFGGANKAWQPTGGVSGTSGSTSGDEITDTSEYARTISPSLADASTTYYEPALLIAPLYLTPPAPTSSLQTYGVNVTMNIVAPAPEASTFEAYEPEITQSAPPPPPPTDWSVIGKEDKKTYVYHVYEPDGTFVGVWTDVEDQPRFSQSINTPGTTMTVQLARSANTTREVRSTRVTPEGHERITRTGSKRISVGETPNTVGESTDVELNYNVDIYAHYGEFRTRVTASNRVRVTAEGHVRISSRGAPLGVRIFSGFILDYDSEYASDSSGVTVTLASHGWELSHQLIKDGSKTTAVYSSQPIETTVKAILDTNPGVMSYTNATINNTGVSVPATFQLNTKLEGIQHLVEQADAHWYWFGHVGENTVYIKPTTETAAHTFVKGKHIKSLRLKRSLENLINDVYFVGGETIEGDPTSVVYRRYTRSGSITAWRRGLHRKTDRRYKLATSTQLYADKILDENEAPAFTTPLTISSARYDIETIKLGQTVAFRNFGNFIDEVVLQIVSLKYTPTEVTVQLGTMLERQVDTLSKVEAALDNEQYERLPDTPS